MAHAVVAKFLSVSLTGHKSYFHTHMCLWLNCCVDVNNAETRFPRDAILADCLTITLFQSICTRNPIVYMYCRATNIKSLLGLHNIIL